MCFWGALLGFPAPCRGVRVGIEVLGFRFRALVCLSFRAGMQEQNKAQPQDSAEKSAGEGKHTVAINTRR